MSNGRYIDISPIQKDNYSWQTQYTFHDVLDTTSTALTLGMRAQVGRWRLKGRVGDKIYPHYFFP